MKHCDQIKTPDAKREYEENKYEKNPIPEENMRRTNIKKPDSKREYEENRYKKSPSPKREYEENKYEKT